VLDHIGKGELNIFYGGTNVSSPLDSSHEIDPPTELRIVPATDVPFQTDPSSSCILAKNLRATFGQLPWASRIDSSCSNREHLFLGPLLCDSKNLIDFMSR
jgi:hypothetical protein